MTSLVRFGDGTRRRALVCIAWTGAGAAPFRAWADHVSPDIDVVGIRLAGRESRLFEEPGRDIAEVADGLAEEIVADSLAARSLALFGQCSGGLIAFELARSLRARGVQGLRHLFVGAQEAPGFVRKPVLAGALREQLVTLGVADHALADPELFELLAPALEADIAALCAYEPAPGPPLDVPVTVLLGDADDKVDIAALPQWGELTTGPFEVVRLPGDHMFRGVAWTGVARTVDRLMRSPAGLS